MNLGSCRAVRDFAGGPGQLQDAAVIPASPFRFARIDLVCVSGVALAGSVPTAA